jgi:hypothetical protein
MVGLQTITFFFICFIPGYVEVPRLLRSPLIGTNLTEKTEAFLKSPCKRQIIFTLSMQLSGLPIEQGRRNNKRTEKNKMT